jgi:hypothetical protein
MPFSLFGRRVPINMHSVQEFIAFLGVLISGAQYGDLISGGAQGARLLPHAGVQGDRHVLDNNQDFLGH